MFQVIKNIIKKSSLLSKIVLLILGKNWIFDVYSFLNVPFKLKLFNNELIKLYPKGQISSILFYRKFESVQLEIFQKILKEGMIVVDAGANIGLYSIIASKIVRESGKIVAFEPSSGTFNLLRRNINLNRIQNIITYNCALGDNIDSEFVLFQDEGYDDAERYIVSRTNSDFDNLTGTQEKISIDTLDNCLNLIGINSIDILKIDTEGYEYFILNGARSILEKSKSLVIFMECTAQGTLRSGTSQEEVYDLVKSFGYQIFYWDDQNSEWNNDPKGCFSVGELWACKDSSLIHFLNNK